MQNEGDRQTDRPRSLITQLHQLGNIGLEIMRRIAELIPPESERHYSNDPAIREAAEGTEIYPWADKIEGQIRGNVH